MENPRIEIYKKFHSQGMDLQQRDLRFTFTKQIFFRMILGVGFKYFLFSPLFGEDSHVDYIIFFKGVETTN